jgi:hypothetical protein
MSPITRRECYPGLPPVLTASNTAARSTLTAGQSGPTGSPCAVPSVHRGRSSGRDHADTPDLLKHALSEL